MVSNLCFYVTYFEVLHVKWTLLHMYKWMIRAILYDLKYFFTLKINIWNVNILLCWLKKKSSWLCPSFWLNQEHIPQKNQPGGAHGVYGSITRRIMCFPSNPIEIPKLGRYIIQSLMIFVPFYTISPPNKFTSLNWNWMLVKFLLYFLGRQV